MFLIKTTEPVKLVNESNKFKFIHFTVFDDRLATLVNSHLMPQLREKVQLKGGGGIKNRISTILLYTLCTYLQRSCFRLKNYMIKGS